MYFTACERICSVIWKGGVAEWYHYVMCRLLGVPEYSLMILDILASTIVDRSPHVDLSAHLHPIRFFSTAQMALLVVEIQTVPQHTCDVKVVCPEKLTTTF